LRTEAGRACLTVTDAGRSFEVEQAKRRGGLGLSSMQERVRLLAGVLTVKSAPGEGTRIHVCVPLARPGPAQ
jgi:signal transduction histidine kinase